jgi:flavodoxin
MKLKRITRRDLLKGTAVAAGASVLAACIPSTTTPVVAVESTKTPSPESIDSDVLPGAQTLERSRKIYVVYDTIYGNTEKIAEAIKEGIGSLHQVVLIKAAEAKINEMENMDLLVVGSPTHGGTSTQFVKDFLGDVPGKRLQNIHAAAFDTGFTPENQGGFVKFIIGMLGYAAPRIAGLLAKKGADVIGSETFFVLGKEGPIKEGEINRAKEWANGLMKSFSTG